MKKNQKKKINKLTINKNFIYTFIQILIYLYLLSPFSTNYFGTSDFNSFENSKNKYILFLIVNLGLILFSSYWFFNSFYKKSSNIVSSVFKTFFVVFIFISIYIVIDKWKVKTHLSKYGEAKFAICTDKKIRLRSHIIYYKFNDNDDKAIFGQRPIASKFYKSYEVGDTVFNISISSKNNKIFEIVGLY